MKVAVVRNRDRSGVLNAFGRPSPERYAEKTVQRVADELRTGGHEVSVLEADCALPTALAMTLPTIDAADPAGPAGMVFNMAYGIQGECRYTHLPAMLEMAGVPYTGSGPLGHTLALDKVVTKTLIAHAGVRTPRSVVTSIPDDPELSVLRFPVVVKPRQESTSYGLRLAEDRGQAREAIDEVVARYRQDALVEEYIDGREVCVGLIGNGPTTTCLPAVEIDFGQRTSRLLTHADKFKRAQEQAERVCPAPLGPATLLEIEQAALASFAACHCRDYARVDIRVDHDGVPWVLEINSMASLGGGGSYVLAAQVAGYDHTALVNLILDTAWHRYRAEAPAEAPATLAPRSA